MEQTLITERLDHLHPVAMDRDEADFPAPRFQDDEEGGGEAAGDGRGDGADSPAPMQRADRAPSEIGGEANGANGGIDDDEEEEEEGEDLMKENGNIVGSDEDNDSSEEEEDDPEEAKRIAEGFIDDDDDADEDEDRDSDDDAERRRKRKRRKAKKRRRQRMQQGESFETIAGAGKELTSTLQNVEEDEMLDEDDLDLIGENTGLRRNKDERRLKRLRRESATPEGQDVEQATKKPRDLEHMFDDDDEEEEIPARRRRDVIDDDDEDMPSAAQVLQAASARRGRREEIPATFEDEMEDFIDDDESDEMDEDLSEGEREQRKEEKRQQKQAEKEARRARRAGFGSIDPNRAGIDAESWAELNDVFGDGTEYAFALHKDEGEGEEALDEDGEVVVVPKADRRDGTAGFKDIFEPSAMKARMMTDEDDRIKRVDFPERFQIALPGEEGMRLLDRILTPAELDECTRWVSRRFSQRSNRFFLDENAEQAQYRDAWLACVRGMVEQIVNKGREGMYLFAHRPDDFEVRVSAPGQPETFVELLQRRDFSALSAACLKFKSLLARRDGLSASYRRLYSSEEVDSEEKAIFERMLRATESPEEIADVSEWLLLKHGQRMRDVQALQQASEANIAEESSAGGFKRPTVVSAYERIKGTPVSLLAGRFGVSSIQLAENVAAQVKIHLAEDEAKPPMELAEEYVNLEQGPMSAQQALGSAKTLLAHEIGKDPVLKRYARRLFRDSGLISVEPTDQGHYKIDEEHRFYNFKFLRHKPVGQFVVVNQPDSIPAPAQYLMILEAEEELLVRVNVDIVPQALRDFENMLLNSYKSDELSEISQEWNDVRKDVIQQACDDFLFPAGKLWVREWLREECLEFLGRTCEVTMTSRLDRRPFESTSMRARRELQRRKNIESYGQDYASDDDDDEVDEKREDLPKVLAVSHGNGDPRRDSVETIFLDSGGRLREHNEFDTIAQPKPESAEALDPSAKHPSREFVQLLVSRRPDVIVVNGFSPRTAMLKAQIQECVAQAVRIIVERKKVPAEDMGLCQIDVINCHDDVARIYQHSTRAAEEHPSLNKLARYCVALARYVQSPLQEFAALSDEDLLALRYDTYQHLIPRERLLHYLERALVAVVNTVCVDINRAIIDSNYANLLRYVAGLGPRKADALLKSITTQLGSHVVNRAALLIGAQGSEMLNKGMQILGFNVWHNACAFLVVRSVAPTRASKNKEGARMQGEIDVLDSTRIHPEAYEYARFIAFDALRKTEEDREEGQHPSAWCSELMDDPGRESKVGDIDMADYERNLWAEMTRRGEKHERKLSLLEMVARELVHPLVEQRRDFILPNTEEILTMLTGETKATFDTMRVVNVQVVNITRDFVSVRLDSGIEGTIHAEYLRPFDTEVYAARGERPPHIRDLVKHQQMLKAQIIDVDPAQIRAELTARPSHLELAKEQDAERRRVAVDARYFDHVRAQKEREQAEVARQRKKNARGARLIRHPNFHNFKAGQAEEHLANMPRGTAVVRPSSKGVDHLAVTWKVDEGVYQHLDVLELDKDPDAEVGRILRISNPSSGGDGGAAASGSSYSDLDELLVSHIAPMARMVEMLMSSEKYQGSEEDLHRYLTNFSLANPTRSQYGFAIDKKRPGVFTLGFKANREAPVQRWPVRALPGRFKLNEAELPDVMSLCNAFKTQYTTRVLRAGGRTPAAATPGAGLRAGGRTPATVRAGAGGGYTPMAMQTGATPNPYAARAAGATPNPYAGRAYGGATPMMRPPAPGPPPARPPMPGPPPPPPPGFGAAPSMPPPAAGRAPGIHPDRLAQLNRGGGGGSGGYY